MSMTKCPECDNAISNKASACPHCGYDFQAERKKKSARGCGNAFGYTLLAGLAVFILMMALGNKAEKDDKQRDVSGLTEADKRHEFSETVATLRGANFITESSYNKDSAVIVYAGSHADYKKLNPNTKMTKAEFNAYWTDKTVEKNLVSAVGYVFDKNPYIMQIDVQKKHNGKTFHLSVNQNAFKRFDMNVSMKTKFKLGTDFTERYVYHDQARQLFMSYFKK